MVTGSGDLVRTKLIIDYARNFEPANYARGASTLPLCFYFTDWQNFRNGNRRVTSYVLEYI